MDSITKENLGLVGDITQTLAKIQSWKLSQAEDPKMILPSHEQFELFYQGINAVGLRPVVSIQGNIITLKALDSIQISAEALLELLCDKLKQPVIVPSEIEIKSLPPFVADIDQKLKEKLFWLNAEFNKILALEDPRIVKLCQDYYYAKAYLLMVRLEYNNWEKSLTSYIVKTAEERIELKKNAEIRTIKDDYDKKFKAEQGRLFADIEKYKKEHLRFKNIADNQAQIIENIQNDKDNAKGQIEELHVKRRYAEDKATDMESKYIQAQRALTEALKKLEKYETNKWVQSPTMSQQPAYKNEATKEVFNFPCTMEEFKTKYQLVESKDGFDIFKNKNEKELKIPEELTKVINQLSMAVTETSGKGKKNGKKFPATTLRVLKTIQDSDEPLTVKEIEDRSGVKTTNLYGRHLRPLMEAEEIVEGIENGTKRYSSS